VPFFSPFKRLEIKKVIFFGFQFTRIRVLVVNSLHFVQKHLRHQDTKTQSLIVPNSFALCLCALVAIFPVYPG
jgi:hypothetical protein